MYSLVVAEDEKTMRRGLTEMVDWQSLGFELTAAFDDGQELIEHLERQVPDVVLTDIRMIRVDGLAVAKFIHERRLPTRVVLLSGYPSFEYAQSAVEYHVAHYLLKPISVPMLKEVFAKLKASMDEQRGVEDAIQGQAEHYNSLLSYETQRFLVDAYFGIMSEEEIGRRARLLRRGGKAESPQCLLLGLKIADSARLHELIDEFGTQLLEDHIASLLQGLREQMEYYLIDARRDEGGLTMTGAFLIAGGERSPARSEVVERARRTLLEQLGLDAEAVRAELMDSPVRLADSSARLNWGAGGNDAGALMRDADFAHYLGNQKRLLFSCLSRQDRAQMARLSRGLCGSWMRVGLEFAKNQSIRMLTDMIETITGGNLAEENGLMLLVHPGAVMRLSAGEEIADWLEGRLEQLLAWLGKRGGDACNEDKNIARIRDYIKAHYGQDLTMAEVAEKVYLNPVYMSRLFKEKTGQTLIDYLTEVRMDAAVRYLETTDRYVYEIAEMVGYHNLKYFYKVFKKVKGYSPGDCRDRKGRGRG